ncbi:MAG: Rab family GTPase [Ardenticatenaceae bacterium]
MKVIQKKICLLGDFAVGKSSLVRRFVEGRFDDKYLSTIGVKISRKVLTRPNCRVKMLLWDLSGGQEISKAQLSYLRGTAGALIVCDLTRAETLGAFELYARQVRKLNFKVPLVFIGNKADLKDERVISDTQLQMLCQDLGAPYLLTSAKTGMNVEAAFELLSDQLIEEKV